MKRIVLVIMGLLLLAGCVPGTARDDRTPEIATIIVNAPREDAVPGLADALENEMRLHPDCCSFDIHWSRPVRAQERQRDMYSHRAFISIGNIARSLGTRWGIMVSADGYIREVTELGSSLHVHVTTGVRLHVTDDEGEVLATFYSRTAQGSRFQPAAQELASEYREPLLQELAESLLPDVAAPAVSFLNGLAEAQRK